MFLTHAEQEAVQRRLAQKLLGGQELPFAQIARALIEIDLIICVLRESIEELRKYLINSPNKDGTSR